MYDSLILLFIIFIKNRNIMKYLEFMSISNSLKRMLDS